MAFVFVDDISPRCATCDPTKDADIQANEYIGAFVYVPGIIHMQYRYLLY